MKKYLALLAFSLFSLSYSHAALQIDEGFGAATDLNDWTDSSSNWTFNATGLTYSGWASSGGAVSEATSGTGQFLTLDDINVSISDGQTYWGGFLMSVDVAASAGRDFGFAQNGPFRILFNFDNVGDAQLLPGTRNDGSDPANGELSSGSAQALTAGQTNLILFRVSSNTGADAVDFWLNPDLSGGEGSIGAATWSAGTELGNDLTGKLNDWSFNSSNTGQTTFDELRFGDTFSEVVPEPSAYALIAGCFGLAWVMMCRRRVS